MEGMSKSCALKSKTKPRRILVLVSDTPKGAVGLRARYLFGRVVGERFATLVLYREQGNRKALPLFLKTLQATHPDLLYLHNISWAGVLAGLVTKRVFGIPLVVETGDPFVVFGKNLREHESFCYFPYLSGFYQS